MQLSKKKKYWESIISITLLAYFNIIFMNIVKIKHLLLESVHSSFYMLQNVEILACVDWQDSFSRIYLV